MIVVTCSLTGLCLLLYFLMCHVTQAITACKPGWFGTNCQYKCLCTESHCDSAGQCMADSKCKPGYFGSACQYGDIVQLTSLTSGAPEWLRDGNDATCNSDLSLHSVALLFPHGLSFSWFRIGVSIPAALHRFEIKLNNDLSCANMKNTTIDDTSIDVHCSLDVSVTRLALSGPGVPFLCSVYVSLGRNVASRTSTSHSPINFHGELPTTLVTNETRPRTSADGSGHVCLKTVTRESSWNHRFRTAQSVTALFWTKRNDKRSSGFSLKMFGAAGHLANHFVAQDDDYYIHIQRPQPISLMSISAFSNDSLNLCELFIFGETLCPEGMFGLDCESHCNCTDRRSICLTSTGKCAGGCSDGFYGWSCSEPCPSACRSGPCTPNHGYCIIAPWLAEGLQRNARDVPQSGSTGSPVGCPPGYYGVGCTTPCKPKCNKKCDSVTGECLRCYQGFHGVNCTKKCDRLCFNYLCDEDTGFCLDCPSERHGNFCEEICGEQCFLRHCNSTSGKCFACSAGYKLPDCNKGHPRTECPVGDGAGICPHCPPKKVPFRIRVDCCSRLDNQRLVIHELSVLLVMALASALTVLQKRSPSESKWTAAPGWTISDWHLPPKGHNVTVFLHDCRADGLLTSLALEEVTMLRGSDIEKDSLSSTLSSAKPSTSAV